MEIDVLIGCEESGTVTKEFRAIGINAWSCDLVPTSGSLSEYHIQDDVLKVIAEHPEIKLGIFFPPCTHLCVSGARHFETKRKNGSQQEGIDFFMAMVNAPVPRIAIENPIGIMSHIHREPDQIIQPWMFGHPETKATCLWLKNLPPLQAEYSIENDMFLPLLELPKDKALLMRVHYMSPSPDRGKLRSKTYAGIAKAMAKTWGQLS